MKLSQNQSSASIVKLLTRLPVSHLDYFCYLSLESKSIENRILYLNFIVFTESSVVQDIQIQGLLTCKEGVLTLWGREKDTGQESWYLSLSSTVFREKIVGRLGIINSTNILE